MTKINVHAVLLWMLVGMFFLSCVGVAFFTFEAFRIDEQQRNKPITEWDECWRKSKEADLLIRAIFCIQQTNDHHNRVKK